MNRYAPRVNIEASVQQLKALLGDVIWAEYTKRVASFITGAISRQELTQYLGKILDRQGIRLHNDVILANLANAMRDAPPLETQMLGWSRNRTDTTGRDSKRIPVRAKVLKKEVMNLSGQERRRLKSLSQDPIRRPTRPSALLENRNAKLPRVYGSRDKIQSMVHDIQKGYNTPLAADSFELPDLEVLRDRAQGIAVEFGVARGVAMGVPELVLAGLEHHLKNLIGSVISRVRSNREDGIRTRQRKVDHHTGLSAEELSLALRIAAHNIIEHSPLLLRLNDNALCSDGEEEVIIDGNDDDDKAPRMDPRSTIGISDERLQLSQLLDDILTT